jgi:hypothetical protein
MSKRAGLARVLVLGLLVFLAARPLPALAGDDEGVAAVNAATDAASAATAQAPSLGTIEASLHQTPLYFIENQGQIDGPVAYYVQGKDKTLYFTSEGVTFVLHGSAPSVILSAAKPALPHGDAAQSRAEGNLASQRWAVKLDFVGANPHVQPVGVDETSALISYFKGPRDEWVTGLRTYSGVVYRDLWPGIDLQYSGTVNRLKYQFIVHPGADPGDIRLAYRGASGLAIDGSGRAEVSTPLGSFHDDRPYAYQEAPGGEQVQVEVSYDLAPATHELHVYGFSVGHYDQSRPLVLDPAILVYCGYIGGSGYDAAFGIAVDGYGYAYVSGNTDSTAATFPETVGPDLSYNGGDFDAFVAKVQADGSGLVYCGYIGGSQWDLASDIAVDGSGHAYVVGRTYSGQGDGFPVTGGPDVSFNGDQDAWVAKVRADGTSLVYCGYIGGSGLDWGETIAVDGSGAAYVAGWTDSSEADGFPAQVGPDVTHNGGDDAFVAKVRADGTALVYCGYVGGTGNENGWGIDVDGSGRAYVAGDTTSTQTTFPTVLGPDGSHNGGQDAFLARVHADGSALQYCGYIGGSGDDLAADVAVDSSGYAYIVGITGSAQDDGFPINLGPDLTYNGWFWDAFVAKVESDGSSLMYCGYIGGEHDDTARRLAVDHWGNAYVAGWTDSSESQGFPVVSGPDLIHNGSTDAFVAKVRADGGELLYCGYIGGSLDDRARGIALDDLGNAYVSGETMSSEASFPVTGGPDLSYNGGDYDAFVARVAAPEVRVTKTLLDPPAGRAAISDTVLYEIHIENNGGIAITSMPLYDYSCPTCLTLTGWDVEPTGVDDVLGVVHWENVLDPAVGGPDVLAPGDSVQVMLEYHAHLGDTMYWKEGGWMDYAPKGMPDFDQKQYDWYHPGEDTWHYCGPVAAANSLWWFDSKFEPGPVQTPARSDHYPLVGSWEPSEYDDHDPRNVEYLVNNLAVTMGTAPGLGTHVYGLADGLWAYITDRGLDGYYTVHVEPFPEFGWVEGEVRRSEDVILLLGFWQDLGGWVRVGGHYVTVAGVDSANGLVALSDPWRDWAEMGASGRELPYPHYWCHCYEDTSCHNLASYASHDVYVAAESLGLGGLWGPVEYALECDQIANFRWQNEGDFPNEAVCEPGLEIFTEVEYAVAVSPIAPTVLCKPTDNVAVVGGAADEYGQGIPPAQGHAQVKVNARPALGTVTPPSGSGPAGIITYFSTSWQDPNGWGDLKQCYFHIGASPTLAGNVTLLYNAVKDKLWMLSDDGTTWLGGHSPGTATGIANSQAMLDCGFTTVQGAGDTLTVNWAIAFEPSFAGDKKTGLKCKDRDKGKAKGKWKGTWTVE